MTDIRVIPKDFHKKMYGYEQEERPNFKMRDDIKEIVDECEIQQHNLDCCYFDYSLDQMVEAISNRYYQDILDRVALPEYQRLTRLPDVKMAPSNTWFDINGKPVPAPDKCVLVLDFETVDLEADIVGQVDQESGEEDDFSDLATLLDEPVDYHKINTVPTCATILVLDGTKGNLKPGWYFWIWDSNSPEDLADMGFNNVIIAHNANYDRSFVKSSFYLSDNNIWVDTQSMQMALLGMASAQIVLYKMPSYQASWKGHAVGGALADIYTYFTGEAMSKEVRDLSIKGGKDWVVNNLQTLLEYNIGDVYATVVIFTHLWTRYSQRYHTASINGFLLMSKEILTMDESFFEYKKRSLRAGNDAIKTIHKALKTARESALARHKDYANDPWLKHLDWEKAYPQDMEDIPRWYLKQQVDNLSSVDLSNTPKPVFNTFIKPFLDPDIASILYDRCRKKTKTNKTFHVPKWFHQSADITLGKRVTNYILGVQWKGKPVLWDGESLATEDGWLPHPKEPGKRVVSIFGKNFLPFFEDKTISFSNDEVGNLLMSTYLSLSNWTSIRKRVMALRVRKAFDFDGYLCVPNDRVHGTITRRKAGILFPAAPNPNKTKIGSEIKSMIRVPKGYVNLSADIDSEEARLGGAAGDMLSGYVGSTEFSKINCAGIKHKGTDIHSLMSAITGVKRNLVKNRVYAILYNEGEKKTIEGLRLDGDKDPVTNGSLIQSRLKGTRDGRNGYVNGYASASFNELTRRLERYPLSLIWEAPMPESLKVAPTSEFFNTRFNWLIQSSGVDFLQTFMGVITYLAKVKKIKIRILYTVHDEIHICTQESNADVLSKIMFTAHGYTWMIALRNMGLDTCPLGFLFMESLSVDTMMRKDPKYTCETPTQAPLTTFGREVFPTDLDIEF